eukprot:1152872-Pelagomonas_calceolata.AAC.1
MMGTCSRRLDVLMLLVISLMRTQSCIRASVLQYLHPIVSQLALLPIAAQARGVENGAPAAAGPEAEGLPPCPGLVGGGGMLAHAVARLAAWLKSVQVDETGSVQDL